MKRLNDVIPPRVSCTHGAPMGRYRRDVLFAEFNKIVRIGELKMSTDAGYDHGGAYWGTGMPIFCALSGWGDDDFVWFGRATSAYDAIEKLNALSSGRIRWRADVLQYVADVRAHMANATEKCK